MGFELDSSPIYQTFQFGSRNTQNTKQVWTALLALIVIAFNNKSTIWKKIACCGLTCRLIFYFSSDLLKLQASLQVGHCPKSQSYKSCAYHRIDHVQDTHYLYFTQDDPWGPFFSKAGLVKQKWYFKLGDCVSDTEVRAPVNHVCVGDPFIYGKSTTALFN